MAESPADRGTPGRRRDGRAPTIIDVAAKAGVSKSLVSLVLRGKGPPLVSAARRELVLTPRFSPTQHEITYMQYTGDQPRVFRLNIETGQRELVGDFPNMTFAPRFSPDGQRIVMSVSEGSNSAIVD